MSYMIKTRRAVDYVFTPRGLCTLAAYNLSYGLILHQQFQSCYIYFCGY